MIRSWAAAGTFACADAAVSVGAGGDDTIRGGNLADELLAALGLAEPAAEPGLVERVRAAVARLAVAGDADVDVARWLVRLAERLAALAAEGRVAPPAGWAI